MKKSGFCCCCTEELGWKALPRKPPPLPPPATFQGARGDGREATLAPKRKASSVLRRGRALCQGSAELLQTPQERDSRRSRHPPTRPNSGAGTRGHVERMMPRTGTSSLRIRCREVSASAEPACLYIVISRERQFKAAQTGAEVNVVQLPVKPRAGRNDL